MISRRPLRLVVSAVALLLAVPLACERSDHGVVRGGDGDSATPSGGDSGLGGAGDGDGDGDETGSGGVFVTPGVGGSASGGAPVLPEPLLETCSPWQEGMGGGPGMPSIGDGEGSLLIDDFEDGDGSVWNNGLSGRWESHGDASDGVQSPLGGFREPDSVWTDPVGANETFGPGRDSTNALHMTGSGYEQWGSGQSLYFAKDNDGIACLFDASAYAGITFWAKGEVTLEFPSDAEQQPQTFEVGQVRVLMVERDVIPNEGNEPDALAGGECDQSKYVCWDAPKQRIEVKDCWQKYVLSFEEFEQDGWSKWDSGFLDPEEAYQLAFEVSEYQSYELWFDDIEFYTADDVPTAVTCP